MIAKASYLCIWIILSHAHVDVFGQQTSINLSPLQAQRLWDDGQILGQSISFIHPFSLGTFTKCDEEEISKVFDSNFHLLESFSNERVHGTTAFRTRPAKRSIERDALSAEGCVMACLTEKEFVCRACDYFQANAGKCALHNITAYVYSENPFLGELHPDYAGNNVASTHYRIYLPEEPNPNCTDDDQQAYHNFALGWKAMEAGWYILAHDMLDKAIAIDSNYSMAYIGKILANKNMGYGLGDDVVPSYYEKLQEIANTADFRVKQSMQEQLLIEALIGLHSAPSLEEGLEVMIKIFSSDTTTKKNYILNVVDGNAQLLHFNNYKTIEGIAEDSNTFALQLLTHNLNPYKNGKNIISPESENTATGAMYTFEALEVKGAWQIYSDCVDIAEYYAYWNKGQKMLSDQRDFLFRNTIESDDTALFKEVGDNLVVHQLEVVYMSRSLRRINEYERLHFFQLQLALFDVAENHLLTLADVDEQTKNLLYRMTANAYFSTYDYIYDKYANEIEFDPDWL
ncbi:hypothetical protein EB796_009806 [Bugula neritina]|uniref:Uncharacterized protein n=1 Tax=Bugula neritina TaxID=10212 RepID=A0A7J7K1S0_BUGNE|nr:hypothetical protein EB796_009806 [Bugula neritina]